MWRAGLFWRELLSFHWRVCSLYGVIAGAGPKRKSSGFHCSAFITFICCNSSLKKLAVVMYALIVSVKLLQGTLCELHRSFDSVLKYSGKISDQCKLWHTPFASIKRSDCQFASEHKSILLVIMFKAHIGLELESLKVCLLSCLFI